jgi:uncharacterized membrane protein (DUF485 family)
MKLRTYRLAQEQRANQQQFLDIAATKPRFWENYLIRYLLGTIVGAAMVWCLMWQIPDVYSQPKIFLKLQDPDTTFFLLLLALGFAYCYVSSSFVLVAHYSRWILFSNSITKPALYFVLSFVLFLFIGVILIVLNHPVRLQQSNYIALQFGLYGVAYQWSTMVQAHVQFSKIHFFYNKLAEIRGNKKSIEYIESYRELREHGNAYFIVLSEILLFFYAYAAITLIFPNYGAEFINSDLQIMIAGVFLIAWLLPGMWAWVLATKLELSQLDSKN